MLWNAFLSKGFKEQGKQKSDELEVTLLKASKNNKYPVLCDMSPCLYTMKENMQDSLHVYEPAEFILEYLKDELKFTPIQETVSIFPVCSSKKMEVDTLLVELGELCAKDVIVPETNCCGFAGDRGFTHPELNAHGLRNLKEQIFDNTQRAYATSRTCEIGLSKHSEINHESIVYLVDEVTEPK
ncbi:hypothetical protein [Balneicella halophila]|uniref:hypothetical protein n=1 Tax=Balneicella halophila TaxID=1537566 RepID=UPI0026C74A75|nr:hypothetical protein [Balneicella halophila]